MPERHTGQNITEKLMAIVDKWGISEKISVVVHDQASNMENSSGILKDIQGWHGMKCSRHCLQLCIITGLSIHAIERLTEAASKLVGHFKHSIVANEELKKDKQMEQPEYKLIQICTTQ